MKKIKSFEVDHTKLEKGLYISRVDGDIVTYDLRMVKPNTPPFLDNDGLHTFEHLLATYLRNSAYSENIIYAGPMGCRTGFYILLRNLSSDDSVLLIRNALKFIASYHGEIPGATAKECGNYLEHSLPKARRYAEDILNVTKYCNSENLHYV